MAALTGQTPTRPDRKEYDMSNQNQNTGGVSPRSLILLGAFAALALNRDLRRGLIVGTRDAARSAQDTYEETVRPAIGQTLDTLREEGPHWLEQAQDRAGTLAQMAAARAAQLREDAGDAAEQFQKDLQKEYDKEYAPKLRGFVSDLSDAADERRRAAEDVAKQARKKGSALVSGLQQGAEDLRDEVDDRRQAVEKAAKTARKSGNALLSGLQNRAEDLLDEAGDRVDATRKDARQSLMSAQKTAAKKGNALLSDVQDRAGEWISYAEDALEEGRRDADRRLTRARRQAQKDLRRAHRDWDAAKLERAVNKKLAPLQKQLDRELARLEKDAKQRQHALRGDSNDGGIGGGTLALLALGAGAVVLARVPAARKAVLNAVESVSPDAAESLHSFSHRARQIIGTAWIESIEEPKATPAPAAPPAAKGTQAGTTGATWGGSPAPDAPAAKGMESTSPAPKPGDAPQSNAPEVKAPNTEATTTDEKPVTSPKTDSFIKDQGTAGQSAAGQNTTGQSGAQNSGADQNKKN